MSRIPAFNNPFLLGFDSFERALDRVTKASSDGYPPYNVEQLGPDRLRISLAVAGFALGDLSVSVESNELVIQGRHEDETERVYLHRGIATRQFQRRFVLADGMEVQAAHFEHGLLHIDLSRPRHAETLRNIPITTPGAAGADAPARDRHTPD